MPTVTQDLKTWKFALDQTEYGESAGWAKPEYDDSRWIQVASCTAWETYEYAMADYEGCGWFRTWVEVNGGEGKRYALKFNGIGGTAKVFINGYYVGGTDNRYLPFQLNVTDRIKKGKNLVAVLVDNTFRGREHLPGGKKIEWVLYGGLTHKIYFEEQPAAYISHVRADAQASGDLKVTVTVENRDGRATIAPFSGSVAIDIPGLNGCSAEQDVALDPKCESRLVFELKAENVKTWSPDEPNLYNLNVVLKKDGQEHYAVAERIGFRTIQVEGTMFLLNGKQILLKGASRYDEYAPYGNCPPEDVIREEFLKMKQCGLNLIRTHYPQDDIHYRLADELGLMYMIEVPLNWWFPREDETFADFCGLAAEAVDTLDRTFQNFCNHPCWTVWSTGNECTHSHPACQEMFRMLAKRMRGLNCGRLITYAVSKPLLDSQELDFCDFLSMNYYSGILSENVGHFPEQLTAVLERKLGIAQKLYPNVPHVMSEFGYVCVYGLHGSLTEGRYTEDFGSTFLKADCAEFMKDPQMKGMIIWCWADYRHHRGFIAPKTGMNLQATFGPYGLVTMDRKPKQMLLDVMTDFYTSWQVTE